MTTLSSLVITRQAATIAQVDEALACQVMRGGDLGMCLLELRAIREETLLPLLAEAYALPALAPGPLPQAPSSLLRMVPHAVALTYRLYPVGEVDGELHLAVVEPLPQAVEDDLTFALGAHLKQYVATSVRVHQALARDYGAALERRYVRLLAVMDRRSDPGLSGPPSESYSARPSGEPGPSSVLSFAPRKRTWPGMLAVREGEKPPSPSIPAAPAAPSIAEDFSDIEGEPSGDDVGGDRQPAEGPSEEVAAGAEIVAVDIDVAVDGVSGGVAAAPHPGAFLIDPTASSEFAPTPAVPPVSESELLPTPLVPPVSDVLAMATPDSDPPTRYSDVPSTLPTGERAASNAPESTSVERRAVSETWSSRPPPAPPPHDFVMEATMATAARVERKRQRRAEQRAGKALLGWAQRAAGSAVADDRAKDRRRGPLTPAAAELHMEDAVTGDEALAIFFAFARQYFEYCALFVVHGDLAAGYDAWGPGASREKVRTVGVALDLPNALSHARTQGTAVIAPLQRAGLDADLRTDLGRSAGREVFVLPVLVRQRCVALLYGDQGVEPVDGAEVGTVVAMTPLLAGVLERILLRKKRAMVRQSLPTQGAAESGAAEPMPFVPATPSETSPDLGVSETDDASVQSIIGEMEADSLPPPSSGWGDRDDPLASASMSASPHPPPVSRAPNQDLPRVLIRSDLVDQVISGGERGEKALGEILELGEAAIPSVFARFPGPLTVDRNQAIGDLPRPADCGPVLRIVAAMRRLALPFLAVRSADADVEVRFWATYLLGELNYADVAAALVPRLFDENPAVRRIAVRSARTLAAGGNEGIPLRKALERTVSYSEEPEGRRLIALWTIGELRLYRSIPTLIAVLADPLDSISEAAQRSLTAMTRQEFGKNREKWNDWWETKGRARLP
ncbi:MAG TPA: hypothetical protein VK540_11085 [Polyangiaceae bacterium]|nr:hypothetical protein [Polyangiaceae bacterium]